MNKDNEIIDILNDIRTGIGFIIIILFGIIIFLVYISSKLNK